MKKLSAVVLSAVILLALTGCNNGADSENSDESSSVTSQQSSDTQSEPVSGEPSEVSDISSGAEEFSEPVIVTGSNGETIALSGTPSEPVSKFNCEKFLEKWEDDIENRKPNELAELLRGQGDLHKSVRCSRRFLRRRLFVGWSNDRGEKRKRTHGIFL